MNDSETYYIYFEILAEFVNCIRNFITIFSCASKWTADSLHFGFGILDQHFIFHTKEHATWRLEAVLCLLNLARTMFRYLAGKKKAVKFSAD